MTLFSNTPTLTLTNTDGQNPTGITFLGGQYVESEGTSSAPSLAYFNASGVEVASGGTNTGLIDALSVDAGGVLYASVGSYAGTTAALWRDVSGTTFTQVRSLSAAMAVTGDPVTGDFLGNNAGTINVWDGSGTLLRTVTLDVPAGSTSSKIWAYDGHWYAIVSTSESIDGRTPVTFQSLAEYDPTTGHVLGTDGIGWDDYGWGAAYGVGIANGYFFTATDHPGGDGRYDGQLFGFRLGDFPGPQNLSLDRTTDSGVKGDNVTNLTTIVIDGAATPGDTVTVYAGSHSGQAVVDASGKFKVTLSGLNAGENSIYAIDTAPDGSTSPPTGYYDVTIDRTAPAVRSDTFFSGNIQWTGTRYTLTGGAEAGSVVSIYDEGVLLGRATTDSSGNWSFKLGVFAVGAHSLTLTATDAAGNVSSRSAAETFTVLKATPGDANEDAAADLFLRDQHGTVTLWASSGGLTYSSSGAGAVPANFKPQLTGQPLDINGDGFPDLLFRSADGTYELLQSTSYDRFATTRLLQLSPTWHAVGAGDFDGDGKSDIVLRNDNGDLQLWLHPGSGALTRQDLGVVSSTLHLNAVADFNGDGKADLLFRDDSGDVQMWASNGSGGFTKTDLGVQPTGWHIVGAGDFNGDGKADVLWQSDTGQVNVWLSTAQGTFAHDSVSSIGKTWTAQEVADFNGDGRDDILWRNTDGTLDVWTANATGTSFSGMDIGKVAPTLQIKPALLPADINLDGKQDIVGYKDDGTMQVWITGSSPSILTPQTPFALAQGAQLQLAGQRLQDYNGDGKADFLIRLSNGHYGLMDSGSGSAYTAQDIGAPAAGFTAVGAADFNGDGRADILLHNASTGATWLWQSAGNNSTANFTTVVLANPGASWSVAAAGDFNGDGAADILWRSTSGQTSLWLLNGSGQSISHLDLGSMSSAWTVAATGDFNGDGKLDILWRNGSTGAVQMWASQADSNNFNQVSLGQMASNWSLVQADDYTGDSRADILWRDGFGHMQLWISIPGTTPFTHMGLPTISTDWHLT